MDYAPEQFARFVQLFRGRVDVYARRWTNCSGDSGYSPARQGENYLPMTPAVLASHLMGRTTIGVYPLRSDDTCRFLAADFDGAGYEEDAGAFVDACSDAGIPAYIERSRSGAGAHVWIFFAEPLQASLARALGHTMLARARRSGAEMSSFDRLFPCQNHSGGIGNLIALPLQGESINQGGSVFLDRHFRIIPDQWAFLMSIKQVPTSDILALDLIGAFELTKSGEASSRRSSRAQPKFGFPGAHACFVLRLG